MLTHRKTTIEPGQAKDTRMHFVLTGSGNIVISTAVLDILSLLSFVLLLKKEHFDLLFTI